MRGYTLAWRRLVAVWAPAAVFLLLSLVGLVWLSGKTVGRQAQVARDVQHLEERVQRLQRLRRQAAEERAAVEELYTGMRFLNSKVFGSLEKRLTPILKDVGAANRTAGLRPTRFSYDAEKVKKMGLFRFGINFNVTGRYAQIVDLLRGLKASPQFLVVDSIKLAGEKGTATDELRMSVHLSTYLAQADATLLKALTAGAPSKDGGR